MLGQKNKSYMIVGKDIDLLTAGKTRDELVVGQIGIFKNGSQTATTGALSAGDKFKISYRDVDGDIQTSPQCTYDLIKKKSAANYQASREQKTFIGFNGTNGSISVVNNGIYYIHIIRNDNSKTWGEHPSIKLGAAYESSNAATQEEIALAIINNLSKNFNFEQKKSSVEITRVGLVASSSVTAANGLDNAATVVQGVKAVSVATNLEYNTGASTVAVGDYIRIGGVGVGTALTSNVYKVLKIDSLNLILDRPVKEASGTYAAATADVEVIPAATINTADFGISIESLKGRFEPGLFKNTNVNFSVTLSYDFNGTPITDTITPFKGVGTYEDVAEMEWELRNVFREPHHVASYPITENLNAVSGKTYDIINIDAIDNNAQNIDGYLYAFYSFMIATEDEDSSTIHTDLKTVFNIS